MRALGVPGFHKPDSSSTSGSWGSRAILRLAFFDLHLGSGAEKERLIFQVKFPVPIETRLSGNVIAEHLKTVER